MPKLPTIEEQIANLSRVQTFQDGHIVELKRQMEIVTRILDKVASQLDLLIQREVEGEGS